MVCCPQLWVSHDQHRNGQRVDKMNEKDKELLAQYHHTISEQLNSRLSESPKFFWVLIAVSGAYGFVLSNDPNSHKELFVLVSIVVWLIILWANWYLAALGYAFRFLQNIQHCAEHALKWSPRYTPRSGGKDDSAFWLLPSIYHPHAAGFFLFLLLDCGAFCFYVSHFWPNDLWCILLTGVTAVIIGSWLMYVPHRYYKCKFEDVRRAPEECDIYSL